MRLLLDTHVALWFFDDPGILSVDARSSIEDPGNVSFVSAASVWEWALKRALGRVSMPDDLDVGARQAGFEELPVTWEHGRAAAGLRALHGDPFDRMLVAQAITEELTLVTRDKRLMEYDVQTIPA